MSSFQVNYKLGHILLKLQTIPRKKEKRSISLAYIRLDLVVNSSSFIP